MNGVSRAAAAFTDRHGRRYRKLRVSVTDRCQMRCRYCMPEGPSGGAWLPKRDILSFEQIAAFVAWAAGRGAGDVRITGGEPLLRHELHELVALLAAVPEIRKISLTTNGLLLPQQLPRLTAAGLDAVTVSLDSLDRERFQRLTASDDLAGVLRGIDALAAAAIASKKLNAVVLRGENDDELPALVRFAAERGMEMRFIEFMPFGNEWTPAAIVPLGEIVARLAGEMGPLTELAVPAGSTSRRWSVPALNGATFGVIPTVSETLCAECDRLRLTADGRVLNCLFDAAGQSVRTALRAGDFAAVARIVGGHLQAKGDGFLAERRGDVVPLDHMHRVGG